MGKLAKYTSDVLFWFKNDGNARFIRNALSIVLLQSKIAGCTIGSTE